MRRRMLLGHLLVAVFLAWSPATRAAPCIIPPFDFVECSLSRAQHPGESPFAATYVEGESPLLLVADPPGQDHPGVWVHLVSGEPVGHLPPEIASWLWPWLASGGRACASTVRVGGHDTPSWRRLLVEVRCEDAPGTT